MAPHPHCLVANLQECGIDEGDDVVPQILGHVGPYHLIQAIGEGPVHVLFVVMVFVIDGKYILLVLLL